MRLDGSLDGIIVPLISPLAEDESLDVRGLQRLVEHVITGGVSGIFVLGSSGEGPSLPDETKERLVQVVSEQIGGRVPLLVGAFGVGTRQTIELARRLTRHGGDAVVVAAPYYFAMTQAEILAHVTTVALSLDVPTMFYNIPSMVKTVTEPETVLEMAATPEVISVKDSMGDMTRFQGLLAIRKSHPDFGVFQGAEGVVALSLARGANGGVLGLANVAPSLCVQIYAAARAGDQPHLWALQEQLMILWKLHTHGQWLPCLKAAVSHLGICGATASSPFARLGAQARSGVRADMVAAGVLPK